MKTKTFVLCVVVLLGVQSLYAQQPPPPQQPQPPYPQDPMSENLFPPELLMQHQKALGLTDDQKNFTKSEIQKAQTKFTDLQWQLQSEVETMAALVKQDRVDEQQALAQLEKVMNLEREMKKTQITLIVRLKNKLTPGQQVLLREIKNKMQGK